jgi:hypothetical protein
MAAIIPCPQSVFLTVAPQPGPIIGLIILQFTLGIPLMGMGLFIAFFGARTKTILLTLQTLVIAGIPVLMPVIFLMMANIHKIGDLSPVYLTSLAAGLTAASNAVLVVLKVPKPRA